MEKKYLSYIIVLFSFYFSTGISQVYRFENYSINDGLSHGYVNSFFQDREGFIWISTLVGLSRYDGYKFQNYTYESDCENCLSHNSVFITTEDKNENLWVGTENGLNKLDKKTGLWKNYLYAPIEAERVSENHIRTLYIDEHDTIWIGTYGRGVYYFDMKTGNYARKKLMPDEPDQLRINNFYLDSDSNFWFGCEDYGILFWDRKTGQKKRFARYSEEKETTGEFTINKILEYKKGVFLVGTWGEGLYVFDKENESFTKHYSQFFDRADSPNSRVIRDIILDKEGKAWLSTYGGGLVIFDLENESFRKIEHDPSNPYSLIHNATWCIFLDKSNVIWVGTYGNGISKFNPNNRMFRIYQSGFRHSNDVRAMVEDYSGIIWVATFNGGLHKFDIKNDKIVPISIGDEPEFRIFDMIEDHQQNLWLTSDGAVLKLDKQRKKYTIYKHNPADENSLTWQSIFKVYEDKKGNIWLGSWNNGIYLLKNKEILKSNPEQAKFINYRHDPNDSTSLLADLVWHIQEDLNGTIWIGTDKGLMKYNEENNSFTPIIYSNISNIAIDSSGNLWVSSYTEGIFKIDPKTLETTNYRKSNSNIEDRIASMIIINDSTLWFTSNKSIGVLNINNGNSQNFDYGHGIVISGFTQNSKEILSNGNILFGGSDGLVHFNPNEVLVDTLKAEAIFTDFLVNNKTLLALRNNENEDIGNHTEKKIRDYHLSYRDKVITIEFASNNYTNPLKTQYKYILEGFDNEWTFASAENRRATYTNLKGGKYVFKVIAANSHGIWNKDFNSLIIYIKPPFWKTWWFKGFAIIVLSLFVMTIYLLRIRRIKVINIQLSDLVGNRTKELNKKNLMLKERQKLVEEQSEELRTANEQLSNANATKDKFFSIIAHDLKNPLNLIMGFSDLLVSRGESISLEKKRKYIDAISKVSHTTFQLLENLLDWARSHTGKINFNPISISLLEFMQIQLDAFDENIAAKHIILKLDISSKITVIADVNMLETIFRNLISNAIKYTPSKGSITVSAALPKNGKTEISVTDTGIGIDESILPNLFRIDNSYSTEGLEGEKGTGLGLILCKEFIERHKGEIRVESICDSGTSFIFTLPSE